MKTFDYAKELSTERGLEEVHRTTVWRLSIGIVIYEVRLSLQHWGVGPFGGIGDGHFQIRGGVNFKLKYLEYGVGGGGGGGGGYFGRF